MNFNKYVSYVAFSFLFAACVSDSPVSNTTEEPTVIDEKVDINVVEDTTKATQITEFNATDFKKLECEVEGNVLENNQKWFPERDLLVSIVADESTEDPDFGESHRLVRVYDSEKCEKIFEEELPVNLSPDYPYYLMNVDSMDRRLVGILGSGMFYVYDMDNNKLSPQLKPQFKGERYYDDAQSGRILQMKTLGRYVIGYAEDIGTFVYNLTIPATPKQEKPTAEFMVSENDFSALFVLKADAEKEYAILPVYDANTRDFSLNMLTDSSSAINEQITKSAQDNRYIVLRKADEKRSAIAIDMQTKKRIELPEDVAVKNTQEVLAWVKAQVN